MREGGQWWRVTLGLALVITCAGNSAELKADDKARVAGIERRLELAERYLNSAPAAQIAASQNSEARQFLVKAGEHLDNARRALAGGDLGTAADLADQSIRAYAAATSADRRRAQSKTLHSEANRALRAEIASYLEAFRVALKEKGPTMAGLLNQQELDKQLALADKTEQADDPSGANQALKRAHQMIVTALTKIRSNETVVYALDFRTPADEYRYERERYDEYLRLAKAVVDKGQIGDAKAAMFNQILEKGKHLNDQAQKLADNGQFDDAVVSMEQALTKLVQGLQLLGVPVSR